MLAGSQALTFEGGAAGSMLGSTGFDSIIANGITPCISNLMGVYVARQLEVVEQLQKLLEKQVADGRSTPGIPQPNDAKINIFKKSK